MDRERLVAQVVGVLFIVATVGSIVASAVLGAVLEEPDYLRGIAAHGGQVTLSVVLFLIAALSAFATSVLLFPVLLRHAGSLAVGYVGLRGFENVFYVAGTVGLLAMLTVGESESTPLAGQPEIAVLGATLLALRSWSVVLGTLIFFGLGAAVLNTILFQSRLVPRWLSAWGILGAVGVFAYGTLGVLGYDTALGSPFMLLAMPIAFQEMVFAGWLLVKGLVPRDRLSPSATPHVPVPA